MVKNPNTPINKLKKLLKERWSGEDHPGGTKRFQVMFFLKDFLIFVMLPLFFVFVFKSCENAINAPLKPTTKSKDKNEFFEIEASSSQIIDFSNKTKLKALPYLKKGPGTLVKVKLLNNLETYSSAPVHAQILDSSLGKSLYGGTVLGEASPDSGISRINITFQYIKDPRRPDTTIPISARALSLDGTYGVIAKKKGNIFARSALSMAPHLGNEIQTKADTKGIFLKALSAGFMESGSDEIQTLKNKLQVLKLEPNTEFYMELTDFFPEGAK